MKCTCIGPTDEIASFFHQLGANPTSPAVLADSMSVGISCFVLRSINRWTHKHDGVSKVVETFR